MILIMRNHVGEFVPGCDHTVIPITHDWVVEVGRRARQCLRMQKSDILLAELRYWDASLECVKSLAPEMEEAIEEALDSSDGWAVLDERVLGPFDAAHADCTQMVILARDSLAIAWSYRVGSEPIRSFDVTLKDLAVRLGSPIGDPLGNPLCDLP